MVASLTKFIRLSLLICPAMFIQSLTYVYHKVIAISPPVHRENALYTSVRLLGRDLSGRNALRGHQSNCRDRKKPRYAHKCRDLFHSDNIRTSTEPAAEVHRQKYFPKTKISILDMNIRCRFTQ